MKKLILSLLLMAIFSMTSNATTWVAAERVSTVGNTIIEKNNLPSQTTFKVVDGVADNTNTATTNIIEISASSLAYTGNDSEVAAVIANEMGHIINGKHSKDKFRALAKSAITSKLSSDNIINTAANSQYVANKTALNDNKDADITGCDLLANTNYNPLAMIVVITKMPGNTIETLQGKPANSERAMNVFDYLSYNYPSRVKTGYGCQEYTAFLNFANPIVEERNSSKKKLEKFNKTQEKNKAERVKNIAQYKTLGGSGWDATYTILKTLSESPESNNNNL